MKTYTPSELTEIIRKHHLYLEHEKGGERANLSSTNLRSANLRSANLRSANLRCADLSYANLRYADLSYADIRYANLSYADLSYAELRYADIRYANLSSANLSYADLSSANLSYADLSSANLSYADIRYADLSSTNLSSANLSYADLSSASSGNNIEVKTLQLGEYYTVISAYKVCVGCQSHTLEEWKGFDDRAILEMDGKDGLIWWKQWRDVICQVAATIPKAPALPSNHRSPA